MLKTSSHQRSKYAETAQWRAHVAEQRVAVNAWLEQQRAVGQPAPATPAATPRPVLGVDLPTAAD